MTAFAADHVPINPDPAQPTHVTAPVRPSLDRDEAAKARRAAELLGLHVPELEPHWNHTIDSATD